MSSDNWGSLTGAETGMTWVQMFESRLTLTQDQNLTEDLFSLIINVPSYMRRQVKVETKRQKYFGKISID